jgi:hypothetical protein
MSKFGNYNEGPSADETERLYGGDNSAKGFETGSYKSAENLPENVGLFGNADSISAEDKIYEDITPEEIDEDNIKLGQKCDDYFHGKGKLPEGISEEIAKELALNYNESLIDSDEQEVEEPYETAAGRKAREKEILANLPKQTEAVDLKPNQIAHATPIEGEKVQLNRRTLWSYISGKKNKGNREA